MDNELKDAVTVEMLHHNRTIIKWLAGLLALSLFINAVTLTGAYYVFKHSEVVVDSYGNIDNSENIGNTIGTYNDYKGAK